MDNLRRLLNENFIIQSRIRKNYKKISKITNKGLEYLKYLRWFFNNTSYKKGKYKFALLTNKRNYESFDGFFHQHINVNYGKTKFPRFLVLNKYLARFLGFYVSEGSARKTKYTSDVFLAARKKEMQKLMKESVEKGMNLKSRIRLS